MKKKNSKKKSHNQSNENKFKIIFESFNNVFTKNYLLMEQQIDRVFELIRAKVEERKNGAILIVGIGGVPGAGKSLFARRVIEKLNENDVCAVQVPMDGFHFYRAELDKFDDPAEAHRRRGTDFTFDFDKYFTLLKNIRENRNDSESIWAPTFEHKVKDPSENAIEISMKTTKVVVSEGNYVCFDKKPWNQLLSFLDLKVFVKCELEEAEKRFWLFFVIFSFSTSALINASCSFFLLR